MNDKPTMTPSDMRSLIDAAAGETLACQDWVLPVQMDLTTLAVLVGALQLALRHPAFQMIKSSAIVRQLVDQIIARLDAEGWVATAAIMRLGDQQEFPGVLH